MSDNEDIKAKMREALDRKKPHDKGVEHEDHAKGSGANTHGPVSSDKMFRRKSGSS